MEKTQIYFFLEELNSINIPLLKKLKNISIIYRNYPKQNYIARALKIKEFAKKQRHSLFVSNDILLAKKLDANLYIPNFNKQLRYLNHSCQKKIRVIGSAHNHQEVRMKKAQGCSQIFVSPLYPTSSHPKKKPIGIIKFNLLRNNFTPKINICALGGINESNIHKVRSFNFFGFALKSYLSKK
ncbi:thiamine phosphate synthase, partial [Pelagibacteraceae bacterium]|nr:thiamine phosphate synthase [Pelagibacteraceae bacterium]